MRRRAASERGMTILEMMIVLGIVGLMMLIGLPAARSFIKTDLREDAGQVASLLRAAYELAALSGVHHRVLFDLDEGSYRLEACPEPMRLKAADEEKLATAETLAEVPQPNRGGMPGQDVAEVLAADSPEAAVAAAAALAGVEIGGARCQMPTTPSGDADDRGNQRMLKGEPGTERQIKFRRIDVQHLRRPVAAGKVVVNFFPLGYAEKAVIELATAGGDSFAVVLHGLTGRVEITDGEFDAERHLRRDAAGDEVDER